MSISESSKEVTSEPQSSNSGTDSDLDRKNQAVLDSMSSQTDQTPSYHEGSSATSVALQSRSITELSEPHPETSWQSEHVAPSTNESSPGVSAVSNANSGLSSTELATRSLMSTVLFDSELGEASINTGTVFEPSVEGEKGSGFVKEEQELRIEKDEPVSTRLPVLSRTEASSAQPESELPSIYGDDQRSEAYASPELAIPTKLELPKRFGKLTPRKAEVNQSIHQVEQESSSYHSAISADPPTPIESLSPVRPGVSNPCTIPDESLSSLLSPLVRNVKGRDDNDGCFESQNGCQNRPDPLTPRRPTPANSKA